MDPGVDDLAQGCNVGCQPLNISNIAVVSEDIFLPVQKVSSDV